MNRRTAITLCILGSASGAFAVEEIGGTDLPFTISESGSYALVSTVSDAAGGITINADNVSLDLRGNTLAGGSGAAIRVSEGHQSIVIRDGIISGWSGRGINALQAVDLSIEGVRTTRNGSDGIAVGRSSAVVRCVARDNGGTGIRTGPDSRVAECLAEHNRADGIRVTGSGATDQLSASASGPTEDGSTPGGSIGPPPPDTLGNAVDLENVPRGLTDFPFEQIVPHANGSRIDHTIARANGGHGFRVDRGVAIESCTSAANGGSGFQAGENCLLVEVVANQNKGAGIKLGGAGLIRHSVTEGNLEDGLVAEVGAVLSRIDAYGNGQSGVRAVGTAVDGVRSTRNVGDGITLGADCTVTDSMFTGNGLGRGEGAGIRVRDERSCIRGNSVSGNRFGIIVEGARNTVDSNLVQRNGTNYQFATGNMLSLLISELPAVIEWPSYVRLNGSLFAFGGVDGIVVNSSDVTIDLAGSSLIAQEGRGTAVRSTQGHVSIANGSISGWQNGIALGDDAVVERVTVRTQRSGIVVGNSSMVQDCMVAGTAEEGIRAGAASIVQKCRVDAITERGSLRRSRSAIRVGANSLVFDSIGRAAQGSAFELGTLSVVSRCNAYMSRNMGFTFDSGIMDRCVASENGSGIGMTRTGLRQPGAIISECVASQNEGSGFNSPGDALVLHNVAVNNRTSMRLADNSFVTANLASRGVGEAGESYSGTGFALDPGLRRIRLENNQVHSHDIGILFHPDALPPKGHENVVMIGNSVGSNDRNYDITELNRLDLVAPRIRSFGGLGVHVDSPYVNLEGSTTSSP